MLSDGQMRGRRITARMRQIGISVTDLAGRVGVSASSVSGWRSGSDIRISHLAKLCNELRCSADWLLDGELIRELDAEILSYVRLLPKHHQAALVDYLKAISGQ